MTSLASQDPPDSKRSPSPTVESPLNGFAGDITPTRLSLLYKGGLAVVTFAMVLLPAIYLALIVLTAYGVFFHLTHNTWILTGHGNGLFRLVLYLGPLIAGGILVVFMVKPFFARPPRPTPPISLDPAREPLLFAFIERICRLVRAPRPYRVDVDSQVNASASLQYGWLSNKVVLTLGLPLAGGLDLRQFAGVLAHEFGHFAQGAGMRLTYIVQHINHWFARVVYERDQWDLNLERWAKESDFRIGIVLHIARGCVWLTRRLLWALMHAGHAISCFMLRQMEYDADTYEAKVAGSDAFESTSLRLQTLNFAAEVAYEEVRQSWASKRLPSDVPLLIQHKRASLPADLPQKLQGALAEQKTAIFDTHPCDADRARAARALNQQGIFRLTQPASTLFSDFAQLSRTVTRHHYEKILELEFTDENLISPEQMLRESAENAQADAATRALYGDVSAGLAPLFSEDISLPPLTEAGAVLAQWREAKLQCERLRGAAEQSAQGCDESLAEILNYTIAKHLLEAGFTVPAGEFKLPESATSVGEQQAAVAQRLEAVSKALAQRLAAVEPFLAAVRSRVIAAVQLLQSPDVAKSLEQPAALPTEAPSLLVLSARLGQIVPVLHQIGRQLRAFMLIIENRKNHSNLAQVDGAIGRLAGELRRGLETIRPKLSGLAYPFAHARGPISVTDYARYEKPCEHEWEAVFQDSSAHLERLFALHHRVLGRLFTIVVLVEHRLH